MKYLKLLFLTLIPLCLLAQPNRPLSGKVMSVDNNTPVEGATVRLLKGRHATTTAADGSFQLPMLHPNDTLVVSHIAFNTYRQTVVNTTTDLVIHVQPALAQLADVAVNTGYQSISKERQTGSFEKISNAMLNQQQGPDILSRLKGVSTINFDNTAPRPAITIRGLSSIFGPKEPLIILDNFPYDGNIQNINPNDIESVTILKDAAATSIWGTRAGNGVIVITTKKGRYNQPLQVELAMNMQVTDRPVFDVLRPISSSSFIDVEQFLFGKGYYNNLEANVNRPALSPVVEILIAARNGSISNTEADRQINELRNQDVLNDFKNHVYSRGANLQTAISLRGGSNAFAYSLSAGVDDNSSVLAARYSRRNLRSENTWRPFKNLRLSAGITYTQSNTTSGKPSYESFTKLYPYATFLDPNGNPAAVIRNYRRAYTDTAGSGKLLDWNYYPLQDYKHNTTSGALQDIILNLGAAYNLLKGVGLELKYQYEKQDVLTRNVQDINSFFTRDLINRFTQLNRVTGVTQYPVPKGDIVDQAYQATITNAGRVQLNVDQSFYKHNINAIAGAEVREAGLTFNRYRLYGFNENVLTAANVDYANTYRTFINGAAAAIPSNSGMSQRINRFVSMYANAAYTYNDLFVISGSIRRDASNMFGVKTNDKWQPLWSAGAAWNISKENFWNSTAVPYLRARFTYGFSGNVDQSRSAVTTIIYSPVPAAQTNLTAAVINQYANPELRWEKLRTANIGIDFACKKEWLSGSIEYYTKKGSDLFGQAPVDYTAGLGTRTVTRNVAAMKGQGIDLQLNIILLNKSLKWSSSLLAAYATSKVTDYHVTNTRAADFVNRGVTISPLVGHPVYSIISYQWAGLDTAGNPMGMVNGKPSTDYATITGNSTPVSDLVFSGPAMPPLQGAFINNWQFRGFTLSANIAYRFGYFFKKSSISYDALFAQWIGHADFEKRWQKPGDEATTSVPSMVYPNNTARDAFYYNSEVLVAKADNIRLQYINLGYTFYRSKWKALPFNNVQVTFNAANLGFLWRANKEKLDPDYPGLPPGKSYALSARISF